MRCCIPLTGEPRRVAEVPRGTFKIEREDAWAMIEGDEAGGKRLTDDQH